MVEIMLGVWFVALMISLPITFLNVRYVYKLTKSVKYLILNQNLAKIGSYWSVSTESFKDLDEAAKLKDEKSAVRSYLYLGVLGFLSALGLLFLIIISLSLQFFVKSRLARRVFESELVENSNLSATDIQRLVEDMKADRF